MVNFAPCTQYNVLEMPHLKFHPCARCLERPVLGSSTNRRHTQACRLTVLARHREDQRREEHADAGCRCPGDWAIQGQGLHLVFSRKDIAFADRLDAALKARGFEPLIDRTDIYAFEEWWKRVEVLITCADTVVFVISPDAVSVRGPWRSRRSRSRPR